MAPQPIDSIEPIVRCERLGIGYIDSTGGVTSVVREASFDIAPGEALGIVGESGSGKSTLARALLGYLRGGGAFLGGSLTVDGCDATSGDRAALAALRGLRVAMVPQNPLAALTYHIPVGRQVEEVLRSRKGLSKDQSRSRMLELLAEMGLPDPVAISKRYPHQLSGGQRQRVVIAAALACNPRLLVLDEPTTALDKTTERQVLALVQSIRSARGAALALVTHDLNVVATVCERVLVMKDGAIVEQGAVSNVFGAPRTDYTRQLLAASLHMDGAPPAAPGDAADLVEARGLDFSYLPSSSLRRPAPGGGKTLDSVSLDLGRGEVLGVIGESGSGKSTLGSLIVGLLQPERGRLALEGESIGVLAAKRSLAARRRIQMVFQDPLSSLNPRQTVGAALMRPLRLFFGLTQVKARAKAVELLSDLGLGAEYLDRYPRQLSGGQQQRVAIARAFAADPDVLICDEITSALDASVQAQVLESLDEMRRRKGVSVLLITHDLAVIWRMASRVLVLKDGRIVEQGPTAQIFADPQNAYTRDLLAAATRAAKLQTPTQTPPPKDLRHAS